MKSLRSTLVPRLPGMKSQKLGQPVPLSNFTSDEKRARSQPAQWKVPARFSSLSGEVNGRSVSCLRSTAKAAGARRVFQSSSLSARHSSSEYSDGVEALALGVPPEQAARRAVAPEARKRRREKMDWVMPAIRTGSPGGSTQLAVILIPPPALWLPSAGSRVSRPCGPCRSGTRASAVSCRRSVFPG